MKLILENIRSLYNVGSIFRTADAVGAEKIYLAGITSAPVDRFGTYRPQLAKVALGSEKSVAWEKVSSIPKLIRKLKGEGCMILALEQSVRSTAYFNFPVRAADWPKLVLILGNEPKGLPKKILDLADAILEIPMRGRKESLNVSVAFGVVAYYLAFGYAKRKRNVKK